MSNTTWIGVQHRENVVEMHGAWTLVTLAYTHTDSLGGSTGPGQSVMFTNALLLRAANKGMRAVKHSNPVVACTTKYMYCSTAMQITIMRTITTQLSVSSFH